MPLQRTIDKAAFGALAANLQPLYTERDGKYYLDVDDSPALNALQAERQAREALEAKLKGYGDLSPEQVKALLGDKTKAERDKDLAAGNFEKILAEEREKHSKDAQMWQGREKGLLSTLEQALIDGEATRAIVAHGGNPALLLPIIKARSKLETLGDRQVAVVIGEKGGPLLKAGAQKSDEYMPISEFVGTLKADKTYAGAFASNVGSGSGGTPRPPAGRPTGPAYTGKIAEAIKGGATVLTKDMG